MSIDILNKEWNISKVKNKVPVKLLKSKGIKFNNKSNCYVLPDTNGSFAFKGRFFEKSELPSWEARKHDDLEYNTPCVFLTTFWEEAQSLMDTPTEEIIEIYNTMLKGNLDLAGISLLSMYNAKDIFTICKDNIEKDLNLDFKDFCNKYTDNFIVKISGQRGTRNEITASYRKKFNSVEMQWNLIPYAENYPIWECMNGFYDVITRYPDIYNVVGVNEYNSNLKKVNIKDKIDNIADLLWDYNLGSVIASECVLSLCTSILTEYKIKYGINRPSRERILNSFDHTVNVLIMSIKAILEVKSLEKNPDKIEDLSLLQETLEILLCLMVTAKVPSYWSISSVVEDIKENKNTKDMVILHFFK
jgi:hypothetical protein